MADSNREQRDEGMMERMGRSLGGMAGRTADAAAGIGGGMIRGAADVLGGWWSGTGPGDAARSWGEAEERRSRQHFEGSMQASTPGGASARAGGEVEGGGGSVSASGYEEVRPLYQLGHTARRNPDYASRNFEDVEPQLRRVWDRRESGGTGASAGGRAGAESGETGAEAAGGAGGRGWPEVRGYVRFGYEQGEPGGEGRGAE